MPSFTRLFGYVLCKRVFHQVKSSQDVNTKVGYNLRDSKTKKGIQFTYTYDFYINKMVYKG